MPLSELDLKWRQDCGEEKADGHENVPDRHLRRRRGVLQHRVSRSREAEPGRDARQRMAASAWLAALFEDIARRTKLEVRGLMMPLS